VAFLAGDFNDFTRKHLIFLRETPTFLRETLDVSKGGTQCFRAEVSKIPGGKYPTFHKEESNFSRIGIQRFIRKNLTFPSRISNIPEENYSMFSKGRI
jgi:hypothetical protein